MAPSHPSLTPVRRLHKHLLIGTALVTVAAGALIASPASAQDECGPTTEGTVTCTAAGNPFPNGINYYTPPVDPLDMPDAPGTPVYDLTVNLEAGVAIESGNNGGVSIIGFNDGSATLNGAPGSSITTTGVGATGVIGNTNYGDLTINVDTITTSGRAAEGINAVTNSGDIAIDAASITTSGQSSTGISVNSYAGNVDITAASVATSGGYANGIYAYAGQGDMSIDVGTVSTEGYVADALVARAIYGNVDISADAVSTAGDYSNGIRAVSFGADTTVTVNAGTITTQGYASSGAIVQGATAVLNVDNITTSGDYAYGAVMFGTGAGGATLTSTGTIATSGVDANGVFVKAYGGDANITVNNVSTSGDSSPAIYGYGNAVNITIDGDVSTAGVSSGGVRALAILDPATVTNNGSVSTTGDFSNGISVVGIYGAVVDGAGSVTTTGTNSFGITATSLFGDASVTAGDVSTSGDFAGGITALSYYGDASVTSTGAISTSGTNSIGALAVSAYGLTDASVTVNDVSTTGDNSPAVYAFGYNASVTVNGDVSTAGAGSPGVYAVGIGGTTTVANNGTITTTGAGSEGIYAGAYGDVVISGTGSVSSTATGINAYSLAGNIEIAQGDVSTTEDGADGIRAETGNFNYVAGDITINVGDVATAGMLANGISTTALYGGTTDITHGAVTTSGDYSFGVQSLGLYDVSVSGGSVSTTGYNAAGVYAVSLLGDVNIDEGTVSTVGDYSPGIVGAAYSGNVTIAADNVTTAGFTSRGVYGIALSGDVDVTVGNVSTAGAYSEGVYAGALNNASVAVTGNVVTSGDSSDAVQVFAYYGTAAVNNTGSITTHGVSSNGIDATGLYGDVQITGTGAVRTTGNYSAAIVASSYVGPISIEMGSVSTTGNISAGISAYSPGGVSVDVGSVSTTGGNSTGISVGGFYSVSVDAGSVSTTGVASHGINAASFGGDVSVTVGNVSVTGAGSSAVRAFGFGGGADVTVTGNVRASQGVAVNIIAGGVGGAGGSGVGDPAEAGIARLTTTAGSSIIGSTNAVTINSVDGSFITNAGSITGGSGYAIQAIGGAATIVNSGSITGRLLLTGNADTLTNSGTFTLVGNSDFGGGTDVLTNTGTVRLGASGATQAVTLVGLETFNNAGLVDLRNGRAGDTLTVGNYSGTGSLGLDIQFGASTATVDRLNVTAATGSTSVILAPLNAPSVLIPATTIVQASTASSPTAFSLNPNSQTIGLIQFGIVYNAGATAYQLVSAPSATAFRQMKLGEGLASIWNRSADAISAHLDAGRDAGWSSPSADSRGRLWLQMFGETNKRTETRGLTYNGVVQNTVDLGYKQDAFGGQVGFDLLGSNNDNGGFTLGISGGYVSSVMTFGRTGDRFNIDTVNGTIYGAYQAGGFFLNGLAKYDHSSITTRGRIAQFKVETDANTWGGKLETGFRLGSDKFFFEPAVSIAYTRSDIDGYAVPGGSFDFDNFNGLRGKAGVRLGGSKALSESSKLTFYAGAAALHEFDGDNATRFLSGTQTISFNNDPLGTYGQGTLGINIATAGGVTGFIEGHGEFGDDYKGGGGRAGIRIKF